MLLALALTTALAGCATAPKPLQGQFVALEPEQAAQQGSTGDVVRWGGKIVDVHTEKLFSCFEIVGAPLSSSGRPRDVDASNGRFLACRSGFYEPEVFAAGREVTISGRVEGFETRKVGDYDYRYPRVAADVIYLWPEHTYYDDHRYMYGPGWGWGWGMGWGHGWYGRW
jgi:outer membrane lipoprotein